VKHGATADGFPDLIAASLHAGTISVLLNTGGGVFAPPVAYPVGPNA
jgi:hypothetical protein